MKKCNQQPKITNSSKKHHDLIKVEGLTERENLFLKLIVEEYINTAIPIGSNFLLEHNKQLDCSSATIRNVMASLERKGFLLKNHTSSGRIPSTKGFKYYEQNLIEYNLPTAIKEQLLNIFKQRNEDINLVIERSVQLISEIVQLPAIITTVHSNAIVKKLELIQLNEKKAIFILVFNDGNIIKNEIELVTNNLINDVSICINILNDRIIDLTIDEIAKQINSISNIIKSKVKNYEFIMQEVITRIFDERLKQVQTNVVATKNALKQKEFQNVDELRQVLNLLENSSIWDQLAAISESKGTRITFGHDLSNTEYKDLVIASTDLKVPDGAKMQISIVGPMRMKYNMAIALLNFIKQTIEKEHDK